MLQPRTHVALLRGVNVGGKSLLKMAELREMLEAQGLTRVATLLQSGNAVFASPLSSAELQDGLETAHEARFGRRVTYFIRTSAEWDEAIAGNPFREMAEAEPGKVLLFSLREAVPDDRLEPFRAVECEERLWMRGPNLYGFFPNGIGRSVLLNHPAWRHFGTDMTARNWNTVLKLRALLRD